MANIFQKSNNFFDPPKRNTFDLSFQNNLTMQFGGLYPVFVKEVIPGDSFQITPTFGLKMMPMCFPVQTRMRANLHFFYVRNRALWKDWPDFIGHTKTDLVPPYLSGAASLHVPETGKFTGSLYDYMGLPTTSAGSYGSETVGAVMCADANKNPFRFNYNNNFASTTPTAVEGLSASDLITTGSYSGTSVETKAYCYLITGNNNDALRLSFPVNGGLADVVALTGIPSRTNFVMSYSGVTNAVTRQNQSFALFTRATGTTDTFKCAKYFKYVNASHFGEDIVDPINSDTDFTNASSSLWSFDFSTYRDFQDGEVVGISEDDWTALFDGNDWFMAIIDAGQQNFMAYPTAGMQSFKRFWRSWTTSLGANYDGDLMAYAPNLFFGSSPQVRVSALPFRAYESIYNAFYRNQQNDPFKINGVPEYNRFIPTDEGGADTTPYTLRYRNWEPDFLTTANHQPLQGSAPLVGVSASGNMTFRNEDGTTFSVTAITNDDGDTITGIKVKDGTLDASGHATLRQLVDATANGISISDFRNVNALQRWLEANMRRGFRYKDQLETHYGVSPRYDTLDYPEFIGGVSENILVNQISATTEANLGDGITQHVGDYAGQASCLGTSEHSITQYCDEHGFIIGILSVSPVPNYSQLLPKHFLKADTLDYFFPEFGHVSPQAISYREVCPIQAYNEEQSTGESVLSRTFGYQRAWYEYLASTDEVHGDFRQSLHAYLLNRTFDVRPTLGADFLHIDPEQLNDVFADTTTGTDKILGQIYFDVKAKRPIPAIGIPRLE